MAETETRENARKVREGIVVSDKMDKTAVVETIDRVRHRRYAKTVQRNKKLHVHDEEIARAAINRAIQKLPVKARFVKREEGF